MVGVSVYIGGCGRPTEREVYYPGLFGCSWAVTEVCRFSKFYLVSVYFEFEFFGYPSACWVPAGRRGETSLGSAVPCVFGVLRSLECLVMLDQFTLFACIVREREFHFVMHIIQLVIVTANGRPFALIVTKIVGMSVGPLGCQFCYVY